LIIFEKNLEKPPCLFAINIIPVKAIKKSKKETKPIINLPVDFKNNERCKFVANSKIGFFSKISPIFSPVFGLMKKVSLLPFSKTIFAETKLFSSISKVIISSYFCCKMYSVFQK
jgi:hypothetical protein